MTIWDDRILEYLEAEGMATPELIAREAFGSMPPAVVRERLRFLRFAGFVFCVGVESWELTTTGQQYLRGEIDARHQPWPTPERVLKR